MKKILFSLLMALPVIFLASCDNDDDLPDVAFNIEYSGGTISDNQLYVVQGDTLRVDSVWVTPQNNSKNAAILSVNYRLDGWLIASVPFQPFKCTIPTASLEPGTYVLGIQAPVIQVDKTPATAFTSRTVTIVTDASQIPATGRSVDIVKPDMANK